VRRTFSFWEIGKFRAGRSNEPDRTRAVPGGSVVACFTESTLKESVPPAARFPEFLKVLEKPGQPNGKQPDRQREREMRGRWQLGGERLCYPLYSERKGKRRQRTIPLASGPQDSHNRQMPRHPRAAQAGFCYHVLRRGNGWPASPLRLLVQRGCLAGGCSGAPPGTGATSGGLVTVGERSADGSGGGSPA
jgi:hypothetical protein